MAQHLRARQHPQMTEPTTRTTTHAGLCADDVIDAALELVETKSPEALTMRRLAAELGVSTTTIYWHVGNRDELIVALISRLAERMRTLEVRGSSPGERVVCAATNIWRAALEHRNVTSLANRVGATTLLHLPLEVALLSELEAAGLRGTTARDAMGSILYLTAGFLVGALRTEERVPEDLRRAALWGSLREVDLHDDSVAAMSDLGDPGRLYDAALRTLVRSILGGEVTLGGDLDQRAASGTEALTGEVGGGWADHGNADHGDADHGCAEGGER